MNANPLFAVLVVFCIIPDALVLAQPFYNPVEWTYNCYPPWGGQYASTITPRMRDSSPDWDDKAPNPPLVARRAMALAEASLRATMKDKIDPSLEQELVGVRLIPLGGKKWCWDVYYEWHHRVGGETGTPSSFRVFVLMNGKVVQPEIRAWNGVEIELNKKPQEKEKNKGSEDTNTRGNAAGVRSSAVGASWVGRQKYLYTYSCCGSDNFVNVMVNPSKR